VQITLAGEFARLGHRVHLIAFEDDGPLRGEVPEDVSLTGFGVSRVAHGLFPLVRFLRKENPDAVIASMAHVGTIALMARILAGWHGKLLVRADASRRYHSKAGSSPKQSVLFVLQRHLLPRAHAVLGVSTAIAREYREDLHLDNCHVVHNPVATGFGRGLESARAEDTSRANHPFLEGTGPVVVAVGRLVAQKGFSFLLRAFAVLRKTHDAKLLILGEGRQRQRLMAEAGELGLEDHVSLPGFVDDPFAYLRRSSVFALSSESEPFGLTLVEALSSGIPVVSTDTEGPRDILDDDRLGELVPFGDIERFAAALARAIDASGENREVRIARAVEFSPERVAARYLQLIENGSAPTDD
jgi:glycosyltransferase involved in cell wall biosynthesis